MKRDFLFICVPRERWQQVSFFEKKDTADSPTQGGTTKRHAINNYLKT
jgi:hypothetical protein